MPSSTESAAVSLAVRETGDEGAVELARDGAVEDVPVDARSGVSEASAGAGSAMLFWLSQLTHRGHTPCVSRWGWRGVLRSPSVPRKTHPAGAPQAWRGDGFLATADRRFADHHRRTVVAAHGDEGPAIALRRACTLCMYGCSRESLAGTHAGSTGASPAKGIGLRASLDAARASMVTGVVCP